MVSERCVTKHRNCTVPLTAGAVRDCLLMVTSVAVSDRAWKANCLNNKRNKSGTVVAMVITTHNCEVMEMFNENRQQLKLSHRVFHNLMQDCDQQELARCIRLLSMYLALYKRHHGEIALSDYLELTESPIINEELAELVKQGLDEASAMLTLVLQDKDQPQVECGIPATLHVN